MRKTILSICTLAYLLISISTFAQAPQKMSYQAVLRDNSSVLVTSSPVGMQISILQGSSTGSPVYVETQTTTTNANGLVSLEIGTGSVLSGSFAGINWANGPYFIKTESDPLGGTAYTISGTSELMSVPYALFSANGTQGAVGATGATGISGTNGLDGAPGATGVAGINGMNGINGATGATGATGSVGGQGYSCWDTNQNGINDPSEDVDINGVWNVNDCNAGVAVPGPMGATGAAGINGAVGATGANGLAGVNGATGTNGTNGAAGATGANGLAGATGATGTNGTNGVNGTNGATGAASTIQGPAGFSCWDSNNNGVNDASEDTNADGFFNVSDCNSGIAVPGPAGPTGAASTVAGPAGAAGTNGTNGVNGTNGATGAASTVPGPTGSNGAMGTTGAAGTNGVDGATGSQGIQGTTGATGAIGGQGYNCWDTNQNGINDPSEDVDINGVWNVNDCNAGVAVPGPMGATGATGTNGTNGVVGATGATGLTGATGITGATGAAGTNGANGVNGANGAVGANGLAGVTGATGTNGTNGVNGTNGAVGATGANGLAGVTGATGTNGANGVNGTNGATGAASTIPGPTGSNGAMGATGNNGTNGLAGITGATGAIGGQGYNCWDTNQNGINDPSEDVDINGVWNVNDCNAGVAVPGPMGATGATGTAGTNGLAGATGATGFNGTNGTNGLAGATGAMGTNGLTGATGAAGAAGTNGTNGTNGTVGATGANGLTGSTGAAGTNGTNGAVGATGANGLAGATGTNGTNGAAGATGLMGLTGATGIAGTNGINGLAGVTGAAGTNGVNGLAGATGTQGTTGAAGTNGINGLTGATGATGLTGTNGLTGVTGANGLAGATGLAGTNGAVGATGATGVAGLLTNGTVAGNTTYWNGSTWVINSSNIYNNGGNIGIGTTPNSTAKLHIDVGSSTTDGILVTGTSNAASSVPDLGAGSRMMFYPGKSAFRAGKVDAAEWDNANVGPFSIAMGENNTAKGDYSTAIGRGLTSSGGSSTALGWGSIASGFASVAIGGFNTASGNYSTAFGSGTTASGDNSITTGNQTTASGKLSTAMGYTVSTNAKEGSFIIGDMNYYTTGGTVTNSSADNEMTMRFQGGYRFFSDDALTTSKIMVFNAGKLGIGTSSPNSTAKLHVDLGSSTTDGVLVTGTSNAASTIPDLGAGSRMMFYPGKSAFRAGKVDAAEWDNANVGPFSIAMGENNTAKGDYSTAIGRGLTSSGGSSTALGWGSIASGFASVAIGGFNTASGNYSTALGSGTTASGDNSITTGNQTTASGKLSTAMGYTVSTNAKEGSFIIGDMNYYTTGGTVTNSSVDNEMTMRFQGGYRFFSDDALTTSKTMVFNAGKLGIGTSLPQTKLVILGTAQAPTVPTNTSTGIMRVSTQDGIEGLDFGIMSFPTPSAWIQYGNGGAPMPLSLQPSGGNVGIGTNAPGAKLEVAGNVKIVDGTQGAGKVLTSDLNGLASWQTSTFLGGSGTWNYLPKFSVSGTSLGNSLIFDDGTNIGIGNTTPPSLFSVGAAVQFQVTATGNVGIKTSPNSNYGLFSYNTTFGADQAGIFAYRYGSNTAANGGTGWGLANVDAAIKSFNYFGNNYSASMYANGWLDYPNSAVLMAFNTSSSLFTAAQYNDNSNTMWGLYVQGNVNITGSISKGSGTFKIDHPLDPENKYLYHSFVESPDMMNVYNGNAVTDANGNAVIELPDYFDALNQDIKYQLTIIDASQFAQARVSKEASNNRFEIKTDKPNIKVSWQVTGVRKDPYAEQNRIVPAVEKRAEEKGKYLYPKAYGKPESMGIEYIPHENNIRGRK